MTCLDPQKILHQQHDLQDDEQRERGLGGIAVLEVIEYVLLHVLKEDDDVNHEDMLLVDVVLGKPPEPVKKDSNQHDHHSAHDILSPVNSTRASTSNTANDNTPSDPACPDSREDLKYDEGDTSRP